jgi:hypothetical protein
MPFSYEFNFLVMFLSKIKSIMTIKGLSLLARGSKGNWKLLASILVVGKRILYPTTWISASNFHYL